MCDPIGVLTSGFQAGVNVVSPGPSAPKLPAMPPPPSGAVSPSDMIIRQAMAAERRRAANGGAGSQFLTGGRGLLDLAPSYTPKAKGF